MRPPCLNIENYRVLKIENRSKFHFETYSRIDYKQIDGLKNRSKIHKDKANKDMKSYRGNIKGLYKIFAYILSAYFLNVQ